MFIQVKMVSKLIAGVRMSKKLLEIVKKCTFLKNE